MNIKHEDGFTLIEIIASIVLISIIIISFIPILTKITSWANVEENEIVSSNLITKVAKDIKEKAQDPTSEISKKLDTKQNILFDCDSTADPEGENSPYTKISDDILAADHVKTYPLNNKNFEVELKVCKAQEELNAGLVRAYIKITNDANPKQLSSSFAYIPVNKD